MTTLVCQPCQNDDQEVVEAAGYCVDCGEYLCAMCYKYHRKPQPCRHHVLLDRDNMPRVPSTSGQVMETCGKHKGKALEYFCNVHDYVGCSVCMTLDHTTCEGKNYIPDIAISIPDSDEYKELQIDIGQLSKIADEQISDFNESLNETDKRHDEIVADVLCFRQSLDEAIDSLENVVRDEVQILKERKTKSEKDKIKSVQDIKGEIERIGSELDMSIRYRQFLKLFIAMKNAKAVTAGLHERLKDIEPNDEIKFEFTPNVSILKLLNALETLGTVTAVRIDATVKQSVKGSTCTSAGSVTAANEQPLHVTPPSPKTKSILKNPSDMKVYVNPNDSKPDTAVMNLENKFNNMDEQSGNKGNQLNEMNIQKEQESESDKLHSSDNSGPKRDTQGSDSVKNHETETQETDSKAGIADDARNTKSGETTNQHKAGLENEVNDKSSNHGTRNTYTTEITIQNQPTIENQIENITICASGDKNAAEITDQNNIVTGEQVARNTTNEDGDAKRTEKKTSSSTGIGKYMLSYSDSDEEEEQKPSKADTPNVTNINCTTDNADQPPTPVDDAVKEVVPKSDTNQNQDVTKKAESNDDSSDGKKEEPTKLEAAAKVKITNPKERVVVFLKNIAVTSVDDVTIPSVTGMASLSDDKIVVCDNENKSVKIVDVLTNIVCQTIKSDQSPWDVCEAGTDKLAVTFPFSKQITIYAKSNQESYKKDYSFSADGGCYGIAYANENLFVTYGDANVIKVMDFYGYVLRTLQNARGEKCIFSGPKHITAGPEGRLFYVANWDNSSVTCLTVLGHVAGIFTDRELKAPRGVAVDSFGLVYICNYPRPSCIQVLTKGLNKVKKLLNKDKTVVNPMSVVYSAKEDWLFVGLKGESVKMYKLTV